MLNNLFHISIRITSVFLVSISTLISSSSISSLEDNSPKENHDSCARNLSIEEEIIKSFNLELGRKLGECKAEIEVNDLDNEELGRDYVVSLQEDLNKGPETKGFEMDVVAYVRSVRQAFSGKGFELLRDKEIFNSEILAGLTIIETIFPVYENQESEVLNLLMNKTIMRCLWRSYVTFSLENKGREPSSINDYKSLRARWLGFCGRAFENNESVVFGECSIMTDFIYKMESLSSENSNHYYKMYLNSAKWEKIKVKNASGIAAEIIKRISDIDECRLAFADIGYLGISAFINEGDEKIRVIVHSGMFEFTCTMSTLEKNIEILKNPYGSERHNIFKRVGTYIYGVYKYITSLSKSKLKPSSEIKGVEQLPLKM